MCHEDQIYGPPCVTNQENHPGINVPQILGFLCEYPKSGSDQSVVVLAVCDDVVVVVLLGMADGVVGDGSAGVDDAGEKKIEITTFVFIFFHS